MSRDPRDDAGDEGIPEASGPDRADGFAELDMRDTFGVLFKDPDVRNFTFAALGALGMIFLILFQQGGDIGGLIIVVLGAFGILLRWSASPALILFVLTYFMVFPFGIPGETLGSPWEIEEGRFRVTDVMLVLSVLVYLACQYRIYGFVSQALPFEGAVRRKDDRPARRPAALIRPTEIAVLLGVCAAFVVLGQLVWWVANSLEVVPTADFPLRWTEPDRARRNSQLPGGMNTGTARFVVLAGFLFFSMLLARLVFGYWRLRTMGPAEGGMVLLDGGWSETSRERQRQEAWRTWGRKRVPADPKTVGTAKAGGKS